MEELKSWGESLNTDFHHAEDHGCTNKDCDFEKWGIDLYPYLIGFEAETLTPSRSGFVRIGKGIFECPKCFTKFWFHLFKASMPYIMSTSPNWPKK